MTDKNNGSYKSDKVISVAKMYFKSNIPKSSEDYMKTYNIFKVGDIAFEGNKSKKFSFGRFVENDIGDGIVSHVFDVFRPIVDYDQKYWKYAIHYEPVMKNVLRKSTSKSTMMTNLVAKDLLRQTLNVPNINEQKQIGSLISSLDKLIDANENEINNTHILANYFVNNIFNRSIYIVNSNNTYHNRKLKNISSFIKDGTHGSFKDASGPYLLSAKNIKNHKVIFDENDRHISESDYQSIYANYNLENNDILLSIVGTLGNVAMYHAEKYPEIAFQRSVAFVRTQLLNPSYLFYYFTSKKFKDDLKRISTTSAQPGVYLNDLGNISVEFNDNFNDQSIFVDILDNINNRLNLLNIKNNKLKELKKYLMQNMFI
ncbi:restriction endonuclease subunit S [Fructilactobacillus sp. Tb1]|uniref:restriction endonuclease subunit S n=1 Tax=Fructilactobacillus sp. Tb1 TaxID=3422304 RepID=UPI003D28C18C